LFERGEIVHQLPDMGQSMDSALRMTAAERSLRLLAHTQRTLARWCRIRSHLERRSGGRQVTTRSRSFAPVWGLLAVAQFGEQRIVGVDGHAAPVAAVGARARSGQAAQAVLGKRTVLPGWTAWSSRRGRSAARRRSRG